MQAPVSQIGEPALGRAPRAARPPLWHAAEIAAFWVLFLVGLWIIGPRITQGGPIIVAYWALVIPGAALVLWLSPAVLHDDAPQLRGWGFFGAPRADPGGLRQAWPFYAAVTAAGVTAVCALAAWRDPNLMAHVNARDLALKFAGYLVWAPIQALVFFSFMQMRLRGILAGLPGGGERPAVIVLTAAVFSLAHAPNLPLMGLTLTAGLIWSWLFYSRPNLMLLSLSHATMGACVHQVLRISTRIGPFYDRPDLHLLQNVIPGLKQVFGNLF